MLTERDGKVLCAMVGHRFYECNDECHESSRDISHCRFAGIITPTDHTLLSDDDRCFRCVVCKADIRTLDSNSFRWLPYDGAEDDSCYFIWKNKKTLRV